MWGEVRHGTLVGRRELILGTIGPRNRVVGK